MQPRSADNQQHSEHSCKHAGILSRFDVAEDASDEAADAAEQSYRKENDASQDQDVRYRRVGEMVHASPPGIANLPKVKRRRANAVGGMSIRTVPVAQVLFPARV
jgi:hypothetical protein